MDDSIIPFFLWSKNYPKYPQVSTESATINPKNIEQKVDKAIWELFTNSEKKLGRLGAYNEIKASIRNTDEDRNEILKKVYYNEKWFLKLLEFHSTHKINPAITDDISKKLQHFLTQYRRLRKENFFKHYFQISCFDLLNNLNLIIENEALFNSIPRTNLYQKALELKEEILLLDYLQEFYMRTKDFLILIHKAGIYGKVKDGEFIRDREIIKKYNESRKGPTIDEKLYCDIESMFDLLIGKESNGREKFYTEEGKIIMSKIVFESMIHEPFEKRWVDPDTSLKKNGYTERRLLDHFNELYPLYEKLKL